MRRRRRADNPTAFVTWARTRLVKAFAEYVSARGVTAKRSVPLRRRPGEMDAATAAQLPLLVIVPMKSRFAVLADLRSAEGLEELPEAWRRLSRRGAAHLVALGEPRQLLHHLRRAVRQVHPDADNLGPAFDLCSASQEPTAHPHVEERRDVLAMGAGPRPEAAGLLLRLPGSPGAGRAGPPGR